MSSFDSLTSKGIIFNERPDSVPYNYRISYRIAILGLMIKICSPRRGCSLVKLHIINDSMDDMEFLRNIKKHIRHNTYDFVIRFDDSLNRALGYALSEGIIKQQGNRTYKLSKEGRIFIDELVKDEKVLKNEKERLEQIKKELDDETLDAIMEQWRRKNVKDK